jgi:shikimate kinase
MERSTVRNVVLTGFMGTGKTTVGRLLADRLGWEFVDTDELIEARHAPIAELFATSGEEAFRQLERELAAELAEDTRRVISTGGRMMLDPASAAALAAGSRVFCLVASPETIAERVLSGGTVRPLLAGPDPLNRIAELLEERREGYAQFEQIDTDGRQPSEIADSLARAFVSRSPARTGQ